MDFALYRLIAAQGGVFTTAQALDHCGDTEVRALVRSGRWRRSRYRGVLLDGELPDTPGLLVRAAALAVGGDLVACHTTAVRLWGFDVLGAETLHFLGPPELGNRRRPGIQIHPSSLGTDDAVLVTASGAPRRPGRRATWCGWPRRSTGWPRWTPRCGRAPARGTGSPARRRGRPVCGRWSGCAASCPTPTRGATPRWSPDALALHRRRVPCPGSPDQGGGRQSCPPARHRLACGARGCRRALGLRPGSWRS